MFQKENKTFWCSQYEERILKSVCMARQAREESKRGNSLFLKCRGCATGERIRELRIEN